jgi:hypothetical protein
VYFQWAGAGVGVEGGIFEYLNRLSISNGYSLTGNDEKEGGQIIAENGKDRKRKHNGKNTGRFGTMHAPPFVVFVGLKEYCRAQCQQQTNQNKIKQYRYVPTTHLDLIRYSIGMLHFIFYVCVRL